MPLLIPTIIIFLDAYVEVGESSCVRRFQLDRLGRNHLFEKQNAKHECSANRRCVGIEPSYEGEGSFDHDASLFKLCLDSIYSSTAWDKYEKLVKTVFKKTTSWGMCTFRKPT